MIKLLNTIKEYILLTGIVLFPLFVLPGFPSPFFVPKEIFVAIIISLVLIITFVKSIINKELKFSTGKFDIAILLLVIAYILGSILKTPNKMEAFFYPGITTFVIFSALFYLIVNQLTKRGKNAVLFTIFISGILLSIMVIFAQLGLFTKIPQLPSFMKDPAFDPTGSNLHSFVYLLALLPFGVYQIVKEKDVIKKIFFGVSAGVIILSIVLIGINMLPGKAQSPIFPTWKTSWEVVVETLKQSPILGAGPANYISAFNLYRPISYNNTNLWQVRFSSANNYYFTLITELGFVGLFAIAALLISIYRKALVIYKKGEWDAVSIIILAAAFAVIPAGTSLIFLLMLLLAVYSSSEERSLTIATNKVPVAIVAAPVFLAIIALGFFGGRAVLAEKYFKTALNALSVNDAKNTYDYMVKAEKLNPYVDRYHASLAQINMALAVSIAGNKNLSETDRTNITQFVQQAISEGKATVTLNMGRSANWEVLAQIYKSIMGFADGSDQFAIQTYTQAVALDPINPNLRILLGGVYYALGNYDAAINTFQLAAVAKNDLANAHFNLAAAYAAKKDYDKAITEMETVISLVPANSEDYKTAQTALEQLKKQKPAVAASTENLVAPAKVQQSNIEPPITLPQEATPPAKVE